MLQRYFNWRERSLHSRNDNRRSLPFDWGLEHLGLDPTVDGTRTLQAFADAALANSEQFFAYTPSREYDLADGVVSFKSGAPSLYSENNTVYARFFEGGKDTAMVILPQWNCSWDGQQIGRAHV